MPVNTDYSNMNIFRTFADTNKPANEKARDKTDDQDPKVPETTDPETGKVIDAVFADSNDKVTMEDFLTLMVAQLKNQDFMNPMDDTQYVTQLAQISSMQQMEEMNYNSKSTYVASLVGKYASAAKFSVTGDLVKKEGLVERVSLLDGEFVVYVDGEAFDMNELMEIKTAPAEKPPEDNNGDGSGDGEGGDDKKPPET